MHSIVAYIVDGCHVSDDYLEVVRFVLSKIEGGRKAFFERVPRRTRKRIIRDALARHDNNREIYVDVMSGRI